MYNNFECEKNNSNKYNSCDCNNIPHNCNSSCGIFIQTIYQKGNYVANFGPIIFDTVSLTTCQSISYNISTGEITFMKPGVYNIDWSINIGGSGGNDALAFQFIQSDNYVLAQSISPMIVPCQITGIGLFKIVRVPTVARLINITGDIIQYTTNPVQACLRITQ